MSQSKTKHNEDSRVKLPAILHFRRLGYTYQSKKGAKIDKRNNIFTDIFTENICRINNKEFSAEQIEDIIKEIALITDNNKDKGRAFFERLVRFNPIKLIDLAEPWNNDFRVVTELSFIGPRLPFRPDITILINGIPLAFFEVKKPNNHRGLEEEFDRMKDRATNENFYRFINQFQVVGFSNNMPYDDESVVKLQGSFYTTPNGMHTSYNNFREEKEIPINEFIAESEIDVILHDNNLLSVKQTQEFQTNVKPDSYANRFATSVFYPERLIFFIRYGIVYVDSKRDGLHKHIIRYPQLFAVQNTIDLLNSGNKKGICWLTQGSGKTALAYFTSNVLRDYFQEKGVITKFYFVVDRLDLLNQATNEFTSRGMTIAQINSRDDFRQNIKSPQIVAPNASEGKYLETMNVVNIQKFSEDSTVVEETTKEIQRVYFLDEVHRGYKPRGTFLANLLGADKDGIFIGLTGTPLLKEEAKSVDIFGRRYIHKYFYDKSIKDGYTLRIKKENISVEFRNDIRSILKIGEGEKIPTKDWELVTKQPEFVARLCDYIEDDFKTFRDTKLDNSLGGMIVAASSDQARMIYEWFKSRDYFKAALVLYDEEDNKTKQELFRGVINKETGLVESEYDIVIVYQMLLTGFDAPRLKRLYLLRQIREHSLLQTLARVNRPYKLNQYGYIVDFVDINEQYEETNRRYLEELQKDLEEDEETIIEALIVDVDQVKEQIRQIENKLFIYMGPIENNLEEFRNQLEPLGEKELREIKSCLEEYKECYNELRMSHEDVTDIPIDRISKAFTEVSNKIQLIVFERVIEDEDTDISQINFSEILVDFMKIGEMNLDFRTENDILDRIAQIKNGFFANNDKDDVAFKELNAEFKEIIKRFKHEANNTKKVNKVITDMDSLLNAIIRLNNDNNALTTRYKGDDSYMRIHKRILHNYDEHLDNPTTYGVMIQLIKAIDDSVGNIPNPTPEVILRELKRPVYKTFKGLHIELSDRQIENIIYLFIDEKYQ